ncbi:MAG TPA: helix-turn-helix domain-containing protein [Planctomycetota bacterium]|nr:helix-turn-helix domain-containing protein [Planctomycetota bacterium]
MAAQPRKTTPNPMPDQEILNIDGAAAFLGVSVKTFSKVLREGDVPGRKVGREWKFSRQALVDWVGSRTARDFLDDGEGGEDEDGAEESGSPGGASRGGPGARGALGEGGSVTGAAARESAAARRSKKVNDGFSVDEI